MVQKLFGMWGLTGGTLEVIGHMAHLRWDRQAGVPHLARPEHTGLSAVSLIRIANTEVAKDCLI